jgi:hypothetical protein
LYLPAASAKSISMSVCDEDDEQMFGGDNIRQQDTVYDGR